MSLPEWNTPRLRKSLTVSVLLLAAVAAAGCTVRPLYAEGPTAADGSRTGASAELAAIAIKPVTTRYAQEVRNRLIFAFNNGAAQTTAPRYSLSIQVTKLTESVASVQVATEDEPTAGSLTMISTYLLTDAASGKQVASGRRQISSSYDIPRQEFSAERAVRDAENRAARELAELLRLAIAQDLSRR